MADRLGVSYSQMSGLALAAELAGISTNTLASAMTKADISIVNAQRGSKTAIDAFEKIGLSIDDLGKLNPQQRFDTIVDAIAALPSAAERSAAAVALFGKSGAELMPLFRSGAVGIKEAHDWAEKLGLTLTNVQGTNVQEMNDSWTLVKKSIEGVITQVVANLAPAIKAINQIWLSFVESTGGKDLGVSISDALMSGAEYLASVVDDFVARTGGVWDYVGSIAVSWSEVWRYASQVTSALAGVGRLLSTAFLGLVRLAITPMSYLVEKVADLASLVPGMGSTAAQIAEGVRGFRDGLDASIADNFTKAGDNFNAALGQTAADAGNTLAGPFSDAVRRARDAMLAARQPDAAPGEDGTIKVDPIKVEVDTSKLVSALDVRTKEGNKEMLRLIYGSKGNVDEQQLQEQRKGNELLEEVAVNTATGNLMEVAFIA
jgi:hypothetical protein